MLLSTPRADLTVTPASSLPDVASVIFPFTILCCAITGDAAVSRMIIVNSCFMFICFGDECL